MNKSLIVVPEPVDMEGKGLKEVIVIILGSRSVLAPGMFSELKFSFEGWQDGAVGNSTYR